MFPNIWQNQMKCEFRSVLAFNFSEMFSQEKLQLGCAMSGRPNTVQPFWGKSFININWQYHLKKPTVTEEIRTRHHPSAFNGSCFFLLHFKHHILEVWGGGEKVVAAKMILLARKTSWKQAKIISLQMPLAFLYLYKDSLNQRFTKAWGLCVWPPVTKVHVQAHWGTALIENWNVYLKQKCQTTPPSTFQTSG